MHFRPSINYVRTFVAALFVVGLLSFALISRQQAMLMAAGKVRSGTMENVDKKAELELTRGDVIERQFVQGSDTLEVHPTSANQAPNSAKMIEIQGSNSSPKHNEASNKNYNQELISAPKSTNTVESISAAPSKPQIKLHTVTYATHGGRDDRFCRAVESTIREGHDLVILGWGDKWLGLSQKLLAAQSFAATLPANDLLLFTDAFDVLFQGKPDRIQKAFEEIHTEILFSGECGCWPHVMEDRGKACFDAYPPAPTPYRYLNSGTWIGRAAPAAAMLRAVIDSAGGNFLNANDQKLVADFFIEGRFGIQLDYHTKIFQSMHMTLDKPLPYCNPGQDVVLREGRFYNKRTNSEPAILHFNGGGKRHHLDMEARVWYKGQAFNGPAELSELRAHLVAAPTTSNPKRHLRFDQICPGYVKAK